MPATHPSHPWTFELLGGRLCLDFINTVSGMRVTAAHDRLDGYEALLSWAVQAGALDDGRARRLRAEASRRPAAAAAAFARAIALREALHQLFQGQALGRPAPAARLAELDAAQREAQARRGLVRRGDGYALALDEATDLAAPTWPVALSAADLLTAPAELARVRVCGLHETGECGWLFVDETRAHTRRWCSMKDCGNRAKARRFAARAREA